MHATHVSAHTWQKCRQPPAFGGDHGLVDLSHYHYNNHLAAVAVATTRLLTLIPIGERPRQSSIIGRNYPHHRRYMYLCIPVAYHPHPHPLSASKSESNYTDGKRKRNRTGQQQIFYEPAFRTPLAAEL